MRLQWIMLGVTAALLSGCVTENVKQPAQVPTNVPTQDVLGAEPHYEPYHPTANNDYSRNGQQYQIVRDPSQFSQVGYASIYGAESAGNMTAIGERINPVELTAAHPTLPIPSYVRITNMMNGRMMVVRVNDRGPYVPGKSIAVSRATADRLNLMPTTKIKIDAIQVAQDGTLSGPGTVGSNFVKQSYALPGRPQLGSGPMGNPVMENLPTPENTLPVQQPKEPMQPTMPDMNLQTPTPPPATTTAEEPVPERGFLVQAGAISNQTNAQNMLNELKTQFNVPGRLQPYNGIFRVQLGPFSTRQQAVEVQGRLQSEKNQSSMVVAP
ncbi:endolytic peptidoglycan transglycosylase RlpA [Providencia rettgeri]|uniref:endolytic peptidoglycan transglycosylase RlpA n=1 Tax=Providencia rettgeri TaxID=587 RepID=UPI0025A7466E|nr:endolytic peptidoglycan transglycosylase RlpA [Providencia rettgeri]ELR5222137.1 endolytic peptidoglycan transglycosylase RlpA [Providencia rettgeri]MDX7323201.1 endolytic peptidoglycan transglycosylase RlpA [Providencia rettgeri]